MLIEEAKKAAAAAVEPPKKKAKGADVGGAGAAVAAAPAMPSTISQATAKQFLPDGASVWRGVSRCEWCGHCPPHKRIHAKWSQYGEEGAMLNVLKRLRLQHCESRGLQFGDACPFKDSLKDAPWF